MDLNFKIDLRALTQMQIRGSAACAQLQRFAAPCPTALVAEPGFPSFLHKSNYHIDESSASEIESNPQLPLTALLSVITRWDNSLAARSLAKGIPV
jgi:hypothetical protein